MMLMWLVPVLLIFALLAPGSETRGTRSWQGLALAFLLISVLGGMYMMGGMHYYAGWNWLSVLVPAVLLIGGLGAIIYALVKRPDSGRTEEDQILRLRLAKGEITPEEYDLLREKLSK